jgi:hypothetical protein
MSDPGPRNRDFSDCQEIPENNNNNQVAMPMWVAEESGI